MQLRFLEVSSGSQVKQSLLTKVYDLIREWPVRVG